MISMVGKVDNKFPAVEKQAKQRSFKSLQAAAAYVWRVAFNSIKDLAHPSAKGAKRAAKLRGTPSPPGKPPYSQTGLLKRAIVFAVTEFPQNAVIGPTASMMDESAQPHEFGGEFRGNEYPARPFMKPALDRSVPRLPQHWANALTRA